MTQTALTTDVIFEMVDPSAETSSNTLFMVLEGQDYQVKLDRLGLSFDSSENEILTQIRPMIQEIYNVDIQRNGNWLYKVRKATNSQNIHVIPNSTAGIK